MAAFQPKELLDYLLEANTLTENQLDEFIQANQVEGQYHDYKSGIITTPSKREEGRKTIREYVSGFANSDGGVLLIGVDESKPRKIVECEASIGNSPLEEWASRCLQGMVGYFSPQPRFQAIQHSQGPVLAISVARAPSLIPCVESREMKYFLRIGDSTLQVPEYLIADLVLGRRQHPLLDVPDAQINEVEAEILVGHRKDRHPVTRTSFSFTVENLSLITAEGFEVGVVSWSLNDNEREINKHLRSHLDVIPMPQGRYSYQASVIHRTSFSSTRGRNLDPFKNYTLTEPIGPFNFLYAAPGQTLLCAVYVICKGSPPTWFQLQYSCARGTGETSEVQIFPKGTERPQVSWG